MPLYEYICKQCKARFEQLRPASRMDDPATCPSGHTSSMRVLSMFAAVSKDASGNVSSVGGGGCAGCAGGSCASCSIN